MSRQADAELLSAYLDGALEPDEVVRVERLLAEDDQARAQLEGMRSVVSDLRHLDRLAPPPTLGLDVARRIALAGEHRSLLDRIESGLQSSQQQSNTFLVFSLVFALTAIVIVFAFTLELSRQETLVPVVVSPPGPPADDTGELAPGVLDASTVWVAGRLFVKAADGRWLQDGLAEAAVQGARRVDLASEPGRQLLAERPDLQGVALLGHTVVEVDGEVLELIGEPVDP